MIEWNKRTNKFFFCSGIEFFEARNKGLFCFIFWKSSIINLSYLCLNSNLIQTVPFNLLFEKK